MLPFSERVAEGVLVVRDDPLLEIRNSPGEVAVHAELYLAVLVEMQVAVLQVLDAHESEHVGEHLELLLFKDCVLVLKSFYLLKVLEARLAMRALLLQLLRQVLNLHAQVFLMKKELLEAGHFLLVMDLAAELADHFALLPPVADGLLTPLKAEIDVVGVLMLAVDSLAVLVPPEVVVEQQSEGNEEHANAAPGRLRGHCQVGEQEVVCD